MHKLRDKFQSHDFHTKFHENPFILLYIYLLYKRVTPGIHTNSCCVVLLLKMKIIKIPSLEINLRKRNNHSSGLFNSPSSSLHYKPERWMAGRMGKDTDGSSCCLSSRYHPWICLQVLGKTIRKLSQDSRSPDHIWNRDLPNTKQQWYLFIRDVWYKYSSRGLPTAHTRNVSQCL